KSDGGIRPEEAPPAVIFISEIGGRPIVLGSKGHFDPIGAAVRSFGSCSLDEDEVAITEHRIVGRRDDSKDRRLGGGDQIGESALPDEITQEWQSERGDEEQSERRSPRPGTTPHGASPRPLHSSSWPVCTEVPQCT